MKTSPYKAPVVILLAVSLVLGLCGCCSENQNDCENGLKITPIYAAAIGGGIIGGIVGHQSDETKEGVAVGAVLFSVGQLLSQIDDMAHEEKEHEEENECAKPVVIEIHNSNGSITPVKLKRDGSVYVGPKGERYEELPTEEQLKPIYGL
jgi:hypothetical protein